MASKASVLDQLTRDEMLGVVDRLGLAIADRRMRAGIAQALAASKKATPADILAAGTRACAAF